MIETFIQMRRSNYFWKGISKETIGHYIKGLKRTLKEFDYSNKLTFRRLLNTNDKIAEEVKDLIEQEIKYCEFYFELSKRSKEKNFNEWYFIKKENREMRYDWITAVDCWTKTNGKIRATIDIDRVTGKRVKVSLKIENDSEALEFVGTNKDSTEKGYTHLASEDSIKKQIEEYKKETEAYFKEYDYPSYCREKKEMEALNKMLRIDENV